MSVHIRPVEEQDWKALPALMRQLQDYIEDMYEFLPTWDDIKLEYIPEMKKKIAALDGEMQVV
jgi:hypothetical protein